MVNFYRSAAGFPVYHVQIKDAVTCEASVVANCGSGHEDQDSWGVAHFLEHMCFQGTPTKNKHQVSREQSLVGSFNAYTNQFNTVYHFNALNEDFEKGFVLLKEAVFDSNYPEKEFEKEKSVIVEEWRMYDNYPSEHFYDHITATCFGDADGHPIIGTEQSILDMNPEKLHRFRDKWYNKSNIAIVVVGDLDFQRVQGVIDQVLPGKQGSLSPRGRGMSGLVAAVEKSPVLLQNFNAEPGKKYTFETDRFDQAAYGLVRKWPSSKEIFADRYIARFFTSALWKYMYEYIRDDLGLCYGVGGSQFKHFDNANLIISLLTANKHLEKAETEMDALFEKIKAEGFPDEIFEISKKQLTYNQVKTLDSVHGVSSSVIAGIGGSSDENWFLNEGKKSLDPAWLKIVAAQLTQADLQEFANRSLNGWAKFAMVSTKSQS